MFIVFSLVSVVQLRSFFAISRDQKNNSSRLIAKNGKVTVLKWYIICAEHRRPYATHSSENPLVVYV